MSEARPANRRLVTGFNEGVDVTDQPGEDRRSKKLAKAGVAVGIGSAALVAALLYASKVKKKPGR